jgi:signal transduction histidine kinase
LVFVHDITERKRVEALREDMERIARHDLKGPLNAVINLPFLFQDDPNLTPEQVEGFRLIHQAGLRMLEQIDQSLTLYRIETGSFKLEPQPVDLDELTGQVAGELSALARGLGVELRVEAGEVMVSGDGLLCRTMLSNLLKNAVEAAPRGSRVQVRLAAREGWAEWSVHNGGTVPEAHRARFFDKYFTSGKSRGAGLGTYSARLSAEAQGGSIALRTSEAEGTCITVRLPLWPDRA